MPLSQLLLFRLQTSWNLFLLEFAFLVLAVLFLAEDLLLPVLEEDLLPLPTVADLVEPPADFVLDGFAAPGVAVGFGVTRFTLEPGFPDGPDGFVVGVGSAAFLTAAVPSPLLSEQNSL